MVTYQTREPVSSEALNQLMKEAWDDSRSDSWDGVLSRSLTWVTAHDGDRLVGFVNVAWDGGSHAFLLDATVHPTERGNGIGSDLVRRAVDEARASGLEWVHVDYEPNLADFYRRCGFETTAAGLIHLVDAITSIEEATDED